MRLRSVLLLGILPTLGCSGDPAPAVTNAASASPRSREVVPDPSLRDLLETGRSSSHQDARGISPVFRNVAAAAGVQFTRFSDAVPGRYFLPEVMGGGVGWFDFDVDGSLDLYAVDGCRLWDPDPQQMSSVNRLFRQGGPGRFADVTTASGTGDNRYGQGCAVGDFNADGFPDLYVTNYGRNSLLANNGDGTFADVTGPASVGDESWGTSAVWFDADDDGDADLYVVNYLDVTRANHQICTYNGVAGYCGPGQWGDGVDDVLYLNRADGRFEVAEGAAGAETRHAKGLAVAVADFDADNTAEIYVGNDMAPNFLLQRTTEPLAEPRYQDVAQTSGCALSSDGRNEASMGVACADFDGDGQVDIFLTHYYQHKNTLYRNLGALLFEDDSRRSRTAATSFGTLGFGTVALDFDLDAADDLFIANGHVLGPEHTPNAMNPQLLANDGTGLFEDVSRRIGDYFDQPSLGRGAAGGDYDNDGLVDLAISHLDQPLAILHNQTPTAHHFIGLSLLGTDRVVPAGGRIVVTAGERRHGIPLTWGESYLSSSDPRVVVGVGAYEGTADVSVVWPGGETQTYPQLAVDRYWLLREGGAASVAAPLRFPPEPSSD